MEKSDRVRQLAEDNLEFILQRAKDGQGRIPNDDAVAAQLFCRVVEAETNGGAYGITTYISKDRDRVLAAAAGAVRPDGESS